MLTITQMLSPDFEVTILKELAKEPLRFRDLKKKLFPKFKLQQTSKFVYTEETFAVILTRKLKKLLAKDYISRCDKGHQNVQYSLSENGKRKIRESELIPLISEIDERWFKPSRNMIIKIKEEHPTRMPDNYCFTFVGDFPIAFTKTEGALEEHLIFEKNLHERYSHEVQKVRDEIQNSHPNIPMKEWNNLFHNRIKKEIGYGVGEYYRKLHKKGEKLNMAEKFLTLYGPQEKIAKEINEKRRKR
ncbi:hypothetical protein ACFLRN_02810 [Thermoproteota archaeon]